MAGKLERTAKIRAVALDFDGVITSLPIDWRDAMHQASKVVGQEIKSLLLFYEECFGTVVAEKVSREMEKIELEAIKTAPLLPYTKEALEAFAEKGIDVYVVSMQSSRVVREFLEMHGLFGFFRGTVTRETCGSKKAQVAHLLKQTGLSPSQVLLVDDSKRNITLCSELGVGCFHFQNRSLLASRESVAKESWQKVLNLIQ